MPEIEATGATLVAISPQLEQYSREVSEKHKLSYDLLIDKGNEVADQYGLTFKVSDELHEVYKNFDIDLEKFNGDDSWTLPMPGQFIIDRDSTIIAAEADPDYTKRPEPSRTVETLKALKTD